MRSVPREKHNVLEMKDGLEGHLKQMESRIRNHSESQQGTMQRDTLKRELAYLEQASKLLCPSIEGHDPQKMKDAAKTAAHGAIELYLLHLREELRIIDHELPKQNQLAEVKNCAIDCLAVCSKAIDGSNDPMCKDLVAVGNIAQVVATSTSIPHQPTDFEPSQTPRTRDKVAVQRNPGGYSGSIDTNSNRSAGSIFKYISTGPGRIGIDVTIQSGYSFKGEFSSGEVESLLAPSIRSPQILDLETLVYCLRFQSPRRVPEFAPVPGGSCGSSVFSAHVAFAFFLSSFVNWSGGRPRRR